MYYMFAFQWAVTGDPEGMDGYSVQIAEAVCLGATVTLSSICYYLYRKSRTKLERLNVSCGSCVIDIPLYRQTFSFLSFMLSQP